MCFLDAQQNKKFSRQNYMTNRQKQKQEPKQKFTNSFACKSRRHRVIKIEKDRDVGLCPTKQKIIALCPLCRSSVRLGWQPPQ